MKKRIQKYVHHFFINSILTKKYQDKKSIESNEMITAFFKRNMYNLKTESINERQKFFFSFRTKYINDFKHYRKYYTTIISNFRKRVAYKKFRERFSENEWNRINGDKLARYLSLHDESIKKVDFKFVENIIKIIDK